MAKQLKRKEAREEAFRLLFETEFQQDPDPVMIYGLAVKTRELSDDAYVKDVYFGVREHLDEIDELFAKYAKGWKPERISPVSRSAVRLSIYEMLYREDVPNTVSINEAIELVKKFDDPSARAFVNGILNGVKDELLAKDS